MPTEAMTRLPPGWWIKNSDGSFAGPPPLPLEHGDDGIGDDDGADGRSVVDDEGGLDIRPDSPGWEDMEPDTESLNVQCLLCQQQFSSPSLMLDHSRKEHSFDFVAVVRSQALDFYRTIKYVNLIRSRVRDTVANPTHLDSTSLDSDDFLKPVLENDALLFSLDDLVDFEGAEQDQDAMDGVGEAP